MGDADIIFLIFLLALKKSIKPESPLELKGGVCL